MSAQDNWDGLVIEHILITVPTTASQKKESCALLPTLGGVELNEVGKVWLQEELTLWFWESSLSLPYSQQEWAFSCGSEWTKTAFANGANYDSKTYWKTQRSLLKAILEERRRNMDGRLQGIKVIWENSKIPWERNGKKNK